MAYGVRLKDEATGAVISALRNSATTPRTYSLPDRNVDFGSRFVTPEDYGAVGDGATNDATAIQAAIDSGFPVFFGIKNYRITTGLTLSGNRRIFGSGMGSIISTTSVIQIFTITGINNSISDISLQGNASSVSQIGIYALGNAGLSLARQSNFITNVFFNTLGTGLYVIDVVGSSSGTFHEGAYYVSNCFWTSCTTGININSRGEYNNFSNIIVVKCTTGLFIKGGNNTFVGGHISDNTTGISFSTDSNDGYGVFVGIEISHNTTHVTGTSVARGYTFSSCIFGSAGSVGHITLVTSNRVIFDNCVFNIGTGTLTLTNNSNCAFQNSLFINNPTFSITGTCKFFNNNWLAGAPNNIAGFESVGNNLAFATGRATTLTESTATTFARIALSNSTYCGGEILVTVQANDASDFQLRTLRFAYSAVNKAGTITAAIETPVEVIAVSAGTLTVTITAVDSGSGNLDFKAEAASSLTQTSLTARFKIMNEYSGTISPQ